MPHPPLEIERVYLLRAAPDIPPSAVTDTWRIEQGYFTAPSDDASPTPASTRGLPQPGRLRRITHPDGRIACFHTIKHGQGLVRVEEEHPITNDEFEHLWPRTEGLRLRKTRTRAVHDGLTWEIDRFDDLPLLLAEVELPRAEMMPAVPPWLEPLIVREVTEEPRFRNANLARIIGRGEPAPG